MLQTIKNSCLRINSYQLVIKYCVLHHAAGSVYTGYYPQPIYRVRLYTIQYHHLLLQALYLAA